VNWVGLDAYIYKFNRILVSL